MTTPSPRRFPDVPPRRIPMLRRTFLADVAAGLLALPLLAVPLPLLAAGRGEDEARRYAVMAAFLYNFLLYVEWPDESETDPGPIRIGVLGTNPFGDALTALQKKTVRGRAITVIVFASVETVQPSHILFIPGNQEDQMHALHQLLKDQSVLTVGESQDFTRLGGVARFYEREKAQRLGVEINQSAVDASHLKIRAKLMRLASVVDYPPPPATP